jgi:hypothetical protein
MNVGEEAASLKLIEHELLGFPTRNRLVLHVQDKHVDRSLRLQHRGDFECMREVDEITAFVAL